MKNKMERWMAVSALVLLALAGGCAEMGSASPASDSLEGRIDKHGEEIMASSTKGEAREWMKNPAHIFFKANSKQIAGFVENFYGAGATQVFIADIEEHEGKQFGESLLVVLPKDAAPPAKLFAIGSRVETAVGDDGVKDKGQKYLFYSLD